MDVNVGNFSDEEDFPGMAHAYPVENAYSQYLSSHSGSSNAYTGATSTNYYFEIAAQKSEDAAADAPSPLHPYCHFSTGNFEVLKTQPEARGIDVRQKFMDFHAKHYSANRMKLVILGRESLDVLEGWAADLFAGVRNMDLPQNRWEGEVPLGEEDLLTQCFARPVMDSRHFAVTDDTVAGVYPVCPGTPGILAIQVRLTEEGLKNYKEIVKVIFQYVSLLKETPPHQWIFEEQKGLADVDFKFKQKTPASRFTSQIGAVMQTPLPREWLLSGHSRLRKFDPARIQEALACLRPDNFRMMVVSQNYPGSGTWKEKEKWYGTEYTYEKIPADFLAEVKLAASSTSKNRLTELHLPHENQFIPTKLEVEKKDIKDPAIAPKLIRNEELVRTWYKKDDQFWVPKANLFAKLRSTLPNDTAENWLKSRIYTDLVRDALEEYAYDAELAGLGFSISNSLGIEIAVSGYNDKLSVLLEKVLLTMRDLEVTVDRFEIIKERLSRGLQNWHFQQPYSMIGDYTTWLNTEKAFLYDEILAELPHVTAADVEQFYPHLLRQVHIQTFVHGNLYKEDALKLSKLVETTLKPRALPEAQWPIVRQLVFPPGGNFVYRKTLKDPANVNHCIEYLLFIGDKSVRPLRAKTLLLDQMTHEPAFDNLRTKEQLGYVVFSGARIAATTIGFRFIIQSEKTSEYLESRIDAFLAGFKDTLEQMTDSDFEVHKRSLITKRLEKLKNLDQESNRLWAHIDNEWFDFALVHEDAAHVRTLTKADMIDFYDRFILPSSPLRSKLAVHLNAQTPSSTDTSTAAEVIEKSMRVLGVEKDSKDQDEGEIIEARPQGNGTTPYVITDVREFKSKLQT
ncbi:peptidase M16 inactive domain-containing protein [Diplocarpon rosae]|nr:peptidase M16 inactive domain-containing protein [Diplocarpon rosae]